MKKVCLLTVVALLCLPLASCTEEARKARISSRAESYFTAGDYDKAKIEYVNLLRIDSQAALPYRRLAVIWYEEGVPLRAAPFLLKVKDLTPNDLENRVKLARVFLSLGDPGEAFKEVGSVLERSPNDLEALRIAAEAAQNAEQHAQVEQALSKVTNQNDVSYQLAVGTAAFRKGNNTAATQAAQAALKLDPKSAPSHMLMGTIYLANKQTDKAGEEFKTAAELSRPRSRERLRLAQFQIQSGAMDEATKTLQSITAAAPDFVPAWVLLSELSLDKKKYDEALRLLANALNRDPENIDAGVVQAKVLMAKGETDKAVKVLERLDGAYPNVAPLRYEMARCYVQNNNINQAITILNQVVSTHPDFVEAALLLGQLNLRTGNAKAVVDAMLPLTRSRPELNAPKLLLADGYRVLGQLGDAAAMLREQVNRSPQSVEACLALGMVLREQKKNDEAREMLERARQLAPDNPMPLMQLVDFYVDGQDFASAQRLVDEQKKTAPNSATAYFLEGKIFAAQHQWQPAEGSLTKAVQLNPDFSAAYGLLATIYIASNRLPDAAKQLEAVVARNQHDTPTLMMLGIVYERLGSFDKARDVYERLLVTAPEFAPALNNLAFLYAERLQQPDKGYQIAQKARNLQPANGAIADTLGWALFKKRDYQQALPLLREAAGKVPNDPEIQYHLGMCYYMMGEKDPARAAFQQAASSSADFSNKADVQRRLSLLSSGQTVGQLNTEELQSIVRQQPDDILAHAALAEKYTSANQFKQAVGEYEELLKLNPKFVPAVTKLAELYSTRLNDQGKALEYAKTARELSPSDPNVTFLIGRIAYRAGNYDWSYSLLKQAADQTPNNAEVLHALAWAAFSLGNVPEATQQMQRVADAAGGNAVAEDAKTWLSMMQLQDPKSATDDAGAKVTAILKKDPNYAPALLAQAAIATRSGDTDRAAALYQQVLNRFPDYGPAQARLAALYARQPMQLAKAYDLGMKARKTLPDDPELSRTLADISYQRKDYPRALELLQESARKEPLDANHLYYMGMCSVQTKDTSQAREALTQALATGLQDPLASDARRALEQLK